MPVRRRQTSPVCTALQMTGCTCYNNAVTGSIDIGELVTYIDWQCVVEFYVIVRVHLSVSSRLRG